MSNILHQLGDFPKARPSQKFRTRPLVILAPAVLLAFAVLRFAVVHDFLNLGNLDATLSSMVRQELSHRLSGDSDFLYSTCDLQIWDVAMLLLAVALGLRRHRAAAILLVLGLTIDIAVELMKALETPVFTTGSLLADFLAAANAGSFPSGHVARTSVSVGILVALFASRENQRRMVAIALAGGFLIAMGAVSIRSGGHTIGDVLGGYLLAALWIDLLLLIRALSSGRGMRVTGPPRATVHEDVPRIDPR